MTAQASNRLAEGEKRDEGKELSEEELDQALLAAMSKCLHGDAEETY